MCNINVCVLLVMAINNIQYNNVILIIYSIIIIQ